jgi:4-hydroxy-tetrahydrodipicolinate reductase
MVIEQESSLGKLSVRVGVVGALGKMGREVVRTVLADQELALVGAVVSRRPVGNVNSLFSLSDSSDSDLSFDTNLMDMLSRAKPDVCVEFTHPDVVFENAMAIIAAGSRPIIGTTGLGSGQMKQLDQALCDQRLGGMVVPNFAIGAVLLMKFAREAAKYLDHAEIIELHHNQKADAPSGTALKTAEMMAQSQERFGSDNATEKEILPGARGAKGPADIRIHSVRLPGLVAHQEVLFGGLGQTLSIRHDSLNRTSFMPGVALAIKKVSQVTGLLYGLEQLL